MDRNEWLRWRKKGIGASDAYVIMLGSTKYSNINKIYQDKITDSVEEKTGWAARRGQVMEDRIKSLWEICSGKNYEPKLVVNKEMPFMRVSLDGYCEPLHEILEIKLMNKADHFALKEYDVVPPEYNIQVQYQMLVTGCDEATLVVYKYTNKTRDPLIFENLISKKIKPDEKLQKEIFNKVNDFWHNNVLKRREP